MSDLVQGRPALLVIDMQRAFVDAQAGSYVADADRLVDRVARAVKYARAAKMPVLFSREVHRASGVDGGRLLWDGRGGWVSGRPRYGTGAPPPEAACVEGTPAAELLPSLVPLPSEPVFDKRRYSCFIGTELDLLLHRLGVETLLVAGVCTDVCVLWTVGDAFQRDYHARVLEDCVAGTSPEAHERALTIMRDLTTAGRPVYSDLLADLAKGPRMTGAISEPPTALSE
jgi:biuret amidohydrolase